MAQVQRACTDNFSMLSAPRGHVSSDSKGFTMVELLIVIVILGILATVVVFAVRSITDQGEDSGEAAELRNLETANERYWIEHGGNATEQQLVDAGYITGPSSMYDLTVDGGGVLTITNTRTGAVARTSSAGGGGGGGGGGGAVGSLEGLVKNATNEAPIAGVVVCVSATAACDTTDGAGTYAIADVPTGEQVVSFAAAGYTALEETATINAGAPTTQNTAMSPQLAVGDLRIVLTWGASPGDLDSYLWVPGGGQVYYSNKGSLTSAPYAKLDVDDVDGFGPETISIVQLNTGTYSFAVQALGGGAFVPDETTVRVYDSTGLIGEFAPPSGSGNWWRVFTLNGNTGNITPVNTIGFSGGPF
jgi:adhesin/invasin